MIKRSAISRIFVLAISLLMVVNFAACNAASSATDDFGVNDDFHIELLSPLGSGRYRSPSWSPDGRYLAFTFSGAEIQLWILDTEGGELKQLAEEVYLDRPDIVWQNDYHIAFLSSESFRSVNIETDELETLVEEAACWRGFAFDPKDENRLIVSQYQCYPRNVYHRSDLYAIDLEQLIHEQLTDTPDISEQVPIFSHDGLSLAYFIVVDKDLDKGELSEYGIVVESPDQAPLTIKAPITEDMHELDWSPNDNGLAFRARYDGEVYTDAGLFFIDLANIDQPRKLLGSRDIEGGISQFSWATADNKIAIVTVGYPGGGNDLLVATKEGDW